MSEPLCLAPLLCALREAGLAVGFAEHARLKHIFSLAPSGADEARLRSLLRAVLVKSEEDLAPFDRVFDAWLQEAESELRRKTFAASIPLAPTAPQPGPATGTIPEPSRAPEWLAVAAVCVAAAVAIWLVAFPPSEVKTGPAPSPQQEAPKTRQEPPGTLVETPRDTFKTVRPQVTITAVQPKWQGWPEAVLGGLALLATALAYWQFRRRRWLPEPEPAPSRQGPPRVWVESADAGPLLLGPDDQQALVWGIGHFVSETPTRRLDLAATVRATARAGGIPSVHFLTARHQREVWLWLDESAEDPSLRRLADEIAALLPAYGLAVERAGFWGLPETLSTPQGQRFAPKEVEERSAVALVAVLTDGRLLLRQYEADDRRPHADALLRTLSHWPHLWFVDPGAGANGLAAELARFGIACFHPRELPARLTGERTVVRNGARSATDERLWAAACALSPAPVSEALTSALHRHLRLSATPWALARLRRQAPGPAARLQWRGPDRADRINWLVACQVQPGDDGGNSIFAQALDFWEQALATDYERRHRAAPETWKNLPAERQLRMERHLLALWRNPKAAITGLYPLFQGALKEPIREQLAALTTSACPGAGKHAAARSSTCCSRWASAPGGWKPCGCAGPGASGLACPSAQRWASARLSSPPPSPGSRRRRRSPRC